MKKRAIRWHAAVLSFSILAGRGVQVSAQHDPQKNPGQSTAPKTERDGAGLTGEWAWTG